MAREVRHRGCPTAAAAAACVGKRGRIAVGALNCSSSGGDLVQRNQFMFVPAFALPHQCDDGYPLMRMAASYYSALDYVRRYYRRCRACVSLLKFSRVPPSSSEFLLTWKLHLRENGPFLESSLCLSRACLGKMFSFMYKWLKKTVFTHLDCIA
eukprot:COSAG06_NODE_9868_length_1800_cov_67.102686_2_plen_154_part_00